jgi:hypothetical protein
MGGKVMVGTAGEGILLGRTTCQNNKQY